jgi:DNA (cytosine-5)-methyltransferase 1
MGLHQAWPEAEITGVDVAPQPHYPFRFVQADALSFPLEGYDFIWASPPCQHYSAGRRAQRLAGDNPHPDLIAAVRARLQAQPAPWVMENVEGAPLHSGILLCGEMFGLRVLRHRQFESSRMLLAPPHIRHRGTLLEGTYVGVYSGKWLAGGQQGVKGRIPLDSHHVSTWREVMGIDWMTGQELQEAIPPAYSRYIAEQYGSLPLDT